MSVSIEAERRRYLEWPGARVDGAFGKMTVAHDAMAAGVVAELVELAEHLGHFEFKGALEQLTCTCADNFVEGREWTGNGRLRTFGHGAYLLLGAVSSSPTGYAARLPHPAHPQLPVISPQFLVRE
jgi:hypothetical protein